MVFYKMSKMGDGLLFLNFSRIELFPINQEVVKTSLKTSVQKPVTQIIQRIWWWGGGGNSYVKQSAAL